MCARNNLFNGKFDMSQRPFEIIYNIRFLNDVFLMIATSVPTSIPRSHSPDKDSPNLFI